MSSKLTGPIAFPHFDRWRKCPSLHPFRIVWHFPSAYSKNRIWSMAGETEGGRRARVGNRNYYLHWVEGGMIKIERTDGSRVATQPRKSKDSNGNFKFRPLPHGLCLHCMDSMVVQLDHWAIHPSQTETVWNNYGRSPPSLIHPGHPPPNVHIYMYCTCPTLPCTASSPLTFFGVWLKFEYCQHMRFLILQIVVSNFHWHIRRRASRGLVG